MIAIISYVLLALGGGATIEMITRALFDDDSPDERNYTRGTLWVLFASAALGGLFHGVTL